MNSAVEINHLSYRYPRATKPSLKDIHLKIEKGKFVVIMGATGAGKTTLSLCFNGLIPQLLEGDLIGEVSVGGYNTRENAVQSLANVIGLVMQDPETQIIGRTVEEDTAFGPRNVVTSIDEIQASVDRALEIVRLKGYNHRFTETLSGGEKQRLAIAGVLAMGPEILVLDEPTAELDPVGKSEIYDTLDALRQTQDLTILLIEHSIDSLVYRADEVIILEEGEVVWQGKPADVFRNVPLLPQYGIRPIPVSLLGWVFYQKGWILFEDIPLDLPSAERLLRMIITRRGFRKAQNQVSFNQQRITISEVTRSQNPIIRICNLDHRYGKDHMALQEINLMIEAGEFIALIGQNGAGKTTLAKHLNGLLKPTQGEVIVDGMNTKEFSTAQLSQVIGYVFQNPDHQIFSVSVEKEIAYGLKNAGFQAEEIQKRIDHVLAFTGLEPYREVHPFTLSKGERQALAVASILAMEPKILIIDEPTTGSDWRGVQTIMSMIRDLNDAGTTVLMISHDMELVAQFAKRVVVMKQGRIVLDGPPRDVFSHTEMLREAAIVPPQISQLSHRMRDVGFDETFLVPDDLIEIFQSEEGMECL